MRLHRVVAHALTCTSAAVFASASLAVGPDIVHSDLSDTIHHGPVAGVHAYAWGSHTCNIGDTSLSWINGGTPALAMNAYRLHDGRLMQIGLGNCKTACCVANGNGCSALTCMSGAAGLRPGCRDVYGAGFNTGQGRLGPRSIINPFDGTFQSIPSGSGDAVWRRCQIAESDMSATNFAGALYFAEGVYVCTEENPAEQLNNATYRRCTVANTGATPGFGWTVADTSQIGRPAIYAWRDHGLGINQPDTSVSVVTTDIPGEGRFVVAGKVTTLPAGRWRYDYAVFNINSHVSGASFSLGVPAGASTTDSGFNSPRYHSGEIYENVGWNFSRDGNIATWSTPQTFSQNQNTSALRWGTMYNFWFTSDASPLAATGTVTIGLFRAHSFNGSPVTSIVATGLPVPEVVCVTTGIGAQPEAKEVCPGGTVELHASDNGEGSAPINHRWRRINPMSPGGFIELSDGNSPWGGGSTLWGTNTNTLRIVGSSSKDAGADGYVCVISNPCSSATTTTANITLCRGDHNCSGSVSVQDIFDYVDDYFGQSMLADTNEDGLLSVQDLFTFVERYFSGC